MNSKITRLAGLKQRLGFKSASGIYAAVANGVLTKPVKIGLRASGWPDNEIDAVIDARIAGKNTAEIKALVSALHAARCQ